MSADQPIAGGTGAYSTDWLAETRAMRAARAGVAQHLGVDVSVIQDCLRGRHCAVQNPECAAANKSDPCFPCCTCGAGPEARCAWTVIDVNGVLWVCTLPRHQASPESLHDPVAIRARTESGERRG